MDNYYQILGLTPNASLAQIKNAYRTKAKLYHPDINKAEDAHENFILINEAYEYLIRIKDLRAKTHRKTSSRNDIEDFWKVWQREEKRKARERAQAYARMRYEAYLKSDLYRTTEAVNSVVDFFATAFIFVFVFVLPVLLYLEHGQIALIIAAIIILPTAPLWLRFLIKTFDFGAVRSLFQLHNSSIRTKVIRLILFTGVNLFIFLNIVLNSLVELKWIGISYLILIALAYIATITISSRYKKYMVRLVIAPAMINCFFLINYTFSHSSQTESYWYTYNITGGMRLFASIRLENDKYNNYKGIRFFVNYHPIIENSYITYTFSEGLLGIRVVNKVEVNSNYPEGKE